jgi:transcriptional regulator with XRE-family HTH domain
MNISEKLKQARLAAGLTQEAAAERIGVSRQTISNWENGKNYPDIVSIINLSDVYVLSLDSLLKGDMEMKNHLKESTDVTKSNKRLTVGIVAAIWGAVAAALLFRFFVGHPRDFLPQVIIDIANHPIVLVMMGVVVVVALVGSINIKKLSERQISIKPLFIVGIVVLYVLSYLPLMLVIPEAIKSALATETDSINAIVRVATAMLLLIPAFVVYKKAHYLFDKK